MQRLHLNVVLFIGLCSLTVYAEGTPEDPCRISTVAELFYIREAPAGIYCLDCDIDLSDRVLERPVITSFSGVLDGQGHAIIGLQSSGTWRQGLVGELESSAIVRDLKLLDVQITGDSTETDGVGALAGVNAGTVLNCHVEQTVTGQTYVGGLVGTNEGVLIGCSSSGETVGQGDIVGGLVGMNTGLILACSSEGTVDSQCDAIGGLVGHNNGRVLNCYSKCHVTGYAAVGGLVGDNIHGSLAYCYCTGTVDGSHTDGAVVGYNTSRYYTIYREATPYWVAEHYYHVGIIENCFWDEDTSGISGFDWFDIFFEENTFNDAKGRDSSEMKTVQMFLDAGWDLANETASGCCDYWIMEDGQYPMLQSLDDGEVNMPAGEGNTSEPFRVANKADLGSVWQRPLAQYRLVQDLDLEGVTWNTSVAPWFGGSFDGNDHFIENLTVEGVGHLGLFGELACCASVTHLNLQALSIDGVYFMEGGEQNNFGSFFPDGGHNYWPADWIDASDPTYIGFATDEWNVVFERSGLVGGLVGLNKGVVEYCTCTGDIDGNGELGGLLGRNLGSVWRSDVNVTVQGSQSIGALIGVNEGAIGQCYSDGSVTGDERVGGLVGSHWEGEIINSYSHAIPYGDTSVGGLVGFHYEGLIRYCYSNSAPYQLIGETGYSDEGIVEGCSDYRDEYTESSDYIALGWDFVGEGDNGAEDIWTMPEEPGYPVLRQD